MLKNMENEKSIYNNLVDSKMCHVVVCEDSSNVYKTALFYIKKLRKEVIQEIRDIKKGVWNVHLSDGYEFIFCSSEYFENENLQYSCLTFSK